MQWNYVKLVPLDKFFTIMIYDCFLFYNEFDLLELRLNELKDVVDKFVIVEANLTHQQRPKPLYLEERINDFNAFSDKIIHLKWIDPPVRESNWDQEEQQFNYILNGLDGAKPGDVVLISALDEIPRAEQLAKFKHMPGVKLFCQKLYQYKFTWFHPLGDWLGTGMCYYSKLKQPYDLIKLRNPLLQNPNLRSGFTFVPNGGWHFSYFSDVDGIITKLESYSHEENNTPYHKDRQRLEEMIREGKDLLDRPDCPLIPVEIDDTYPKYLRENIERFKHFV